MSFLPRWLAQLIGDSEFDAAVDGIVLRIENTIWDRISHRQELTRMPEARGFVRARALQPVSRQIAVALQNGIPAKSQTRLEEAVFDRLVGALAQRLVARNNSSRVAQPSQPQLQPVGVPQVQRKAA